VKEHYEVRFTKEGGGSFHGKFILGEGFSCIAQRRV
jgi:hypothetical protein